MHRTSPADHVGCGFIDFPPGTSEEQAALYEARFEYVVKHVRPQRDQSRSTMTSGGCTSAHGPTWGDGRAAEGDGLENRQGRKSLLGSNPSPPADSPGAALGTWPAKAKAGTCVSAGHRVGSFWRFVEEGPPERRRALFPLEIVLLVLDRHRWPGDEHPAAGEAFEEDRDLMCTRRHVREGAQERVRLREGHVLRRELRLG